RRPRPPVVPYTTLFRARDRPSRARGRRDLGGRLRRPHGRWGRDGAVLRCRFGLAQPQEHRVGQDAARRRAPGEPRLSRRGVRMIARLDALLGRVTMYLLMIGILGVLTALALVLALTGVISIDPLAILVSTVVLVATSWIANQVLGIAFRSR